jgi:ribonucleoside-diphosphate reductase alpha chain
VDRSATLDWDALRTRIAQHGMRNSNCVAIAPTATISNIIGVDASIEPSFGNLSVKSNLSGEFTVINEYLVRDLKRLGLWDDVMVMDLKHFDGSLRRSTACPRSSRRCTPPPSRSSRSGWWKPPRASVRQKWIDQAQSLNIYMAGASGKQARRDLQAGLAARPEDHLLPAHHRRHACREGAASAPAMAAEPPLPATDAQFCSIDNPDCERRRQAHHQRPDRRQPAGAVQVQVGLGEVPRHLRQPLDAAGGQHVARHRDCGRTPTA